MQICKKSSESVKMMATWTLIAQSYHETDDESLVKIVALYVQTIELGRIASIHDDKNGV